MVCLKESKLVRIDVNVCFSSVAKKSAGSAGGIVPLWDWFCFDCLMKIVLVFGLLVVSKTRFQV